MEGNGLDTFFKSALGVGGGSAIGAFIFYGLYKDWLTLDIFSKLSGDQTFIIMLVFLFLVFLCALAFLIGHLLKGGGIKINTAKASHHSTATIHDK